MNQIGVMVRVLILGTVVACGGDDDNGTCEVEGGEACFELPTAAMVAHLEAGGTAAPNLSCAKLTGTATTQTMTFSGRLRQYTANVAIPNVTMTVHTTTAFTSPVATATTATDGTFSYSLPAGTPNLVHFRATGAEILETIGMYQTFDASMADHPNLVYYAGTQALEDVIESVTQTENKEGNAAIASVVSDCDGNPIEHAIVAVSSTSGTATHVAGANVFYSGPGELPLPVIRSERSDSNTNGAVGILNVPGGQLVYGQAWGFVDDAGLAKGKSGLKLIAEWEVTAVADSATALPLRAYAR